MYDAYVCLRDVKPVGTHGGTFDSGAWRTRDLNNERSDTEDICTLEANQFVLAPGTYRCLISCPAYRVNNHQARLYNVTTSLVMVGGSSSFSYDTTYNVTHALIAGRFTVEADQILEVQHRGLVTKADSGFGVAATFTNEIYTVVELWRETA